MVGGAPLASLNASPRDLQRNVKDTFVGDFHAIGLEFGSKCNFWIQSERTGDRGAPLSQNDGDPYKRNQQFALKNAIFRVSGF